VQFRVNRSDLQKELNLIQGVVEKKNTIPVLSNILIETSGASGIRVLGTDMEVSLRTNCAADVSEDGAILVNARKLFDIVRNLPDAAVNFRREANDWVTIECARSRFKLVGQPREHFPAIPAFGTATYKVPAAVMASMINNTIFAITQEESRFTLSGALFRWGDGKVRMVATDGHRLAFIEQALPAGEKADVEGEESKALIPKKTLAELERLAADDDGVVEFGYDENHLFFRVGERVLVSRTLAGQFPNYELVMPKEISYSLGFDGTDLLGAIRRVALMADERSRAIKITLDGDRMDIRSQSAEMGEACETLTTEYDGPETTMGFNAQYLSEFLSVSGDCRVRFEFKDAKSQAQFRREGDEAVDYRYVIMPMRI
jgi:DNA polymerase-3 subunit beta